VAAERRAASEVGEFKMKISVLKQEDNEITFEIEGAHPSFLNALRRTSMYEVPALAIEDVYYTKNSSVLYDEIVAHRLGLIPLKTDLKSYNLPSECSCKGKLCAKCSVKGSLKAKGPATVYAEDMKFKDPTVKAIYPKMIITKLLEGQEIELEFVAVLGKGMEHTKWSGCHVYYRGTPAFDTKNADLDKAFENIPANVAKRTGKAIEITDYSKWLPAYEQALEKNGVKITNSEENFILTIESWGQVAPEKILNEAVSILQQKLKEVKLK
jgi:DNA-directed RNA polymerase subunit D